MKTKTTLLMLCAIALFSQKGIAQDWEYETLLWANYSEMSDPSSIWPSKETLAQAKTTSWTQEGRFGLEVENNVRSFVYTELSNYKFKKGDCLRIETSLKFEFGDVSLPMGVFFMDSDEKVFFVAETTDGYTYVGNVNDEEINGKLNKYFIYGEDNAYNVSISDDGLIFTLNGKQCEIYVANIKFPVTKVGYFVKGALKVSSLYYKATVERRLPPQPKAHLEITYLKLIPESNRLISADDREHFVWDVGSSQKVDSFKMASIENHTDDFKYSFKKEEVYKKEKDMIVIRDGKTDDELGKITFKGRCSSPMVIGNTTILVIDKKSNAANFYQIPEGTLQKSVKLVDPAEKMEPEQMVDAKHCYFRAGDKFKLIDLENGSTFCEIPIVLNYKRTHLFLSDDQKFAYTLNTNHLKCFDAKTGTMIKSKVFDGIGASYPMFLFSSDNTYGIISYDNIFKIFETESFEVIKDYTFSKNIRRVVVDKDFQYGYIGFENGELRKVDLASGETVMSFGKIQP